MKHTSFLAFVAYLSMACLLLIADASAIPQQITGEDGMRMVLIPAGEFQMGTSADEVKELWKEIKELRDRYRRKKQREAEAHGCEYWWPDILFRRLSIDAFDDEIPCHTVYLDAFYIDQHEVTNAQYRRFIEATGYAEPKYWHEPQHNQPNQPVIGVYWHDAMAYAIWAGKRLPTEAEWEYAARGGLIGKRYPWGDEPPDETKVQRHGENAVAVGSYAPNGYGLFDMEASVGEWCLDEYQPDAYQPSSHLPRQQNNPFVGGDIESFVKNYTSVETEHVLRGGAWSSDGGAWSSDFLYLRIANREYGVSTDRSFRIGFRCVKSAPVSEKSD
ncbi:SUMF1/EgtB/PvdO family nonheme iron enzyme [Candidatus Poribacteria bacterium]|nr:SUMF1/EgtB/PvdO family nonheme iron enzyme [Candidatus Poribacteria bacterium]